MMKNRIIIAFIFALVSLLCMSSNIVYASDIEIMAPAKSMIVLEGNTNTVLYSHNQDDRLAMASTTKIITAIVAIENYQEDFDKKIKISDKAVGIEGTSIYIKKGEELSMRDLLYGLILASGNDCAVAIAECFGENGEFIQMMNDFVVDLGLSDTHIDNPHGLDSDTHYTSAYDLAIITSYALKNDLFREIVSTERWIIDGTDIYPTRYLKHKNKLLFTQDCCIGVKTGFTDNAGRCLVNAVEKGGMQIISVVLNCPQMFEECDRLTKLALDNYMMKEFIKPYEFVSNVDVADSDKSEIGVITIEGKTMPILKNEEDMYEVKYILDSSLVAPVLLNQKVGTVQLLYKGEIIYCNNLISIESADNNNLKYLIDNIIDEWF
ncbi:MAG: D-alanyl-D-alanine carboxypeptidase [Clostridiales bacterium]|nr:D-alanyl-D-alanine carboxypeptidase [Clostridiales bacterium]